jgi:hypothetical protein
MNNHQNAQKILQSCIHQAMQQQNRDTSERSKGITKLHSQHDRLSQTPKVRKEKVKMDAEKIAFITSWLIN